MVFFLFTFETPVFRLHRQPPALRRSAGFTPAGWSVDAGDGFQPSVPVIIFLRAVLGRGKDELGGEKEGSGDGQKWKTVSADRRVAKIVRPQLAAKGKRKKFSGLQGSS